MHKFKDYLGDGVYAEFDGFHIVLRANSHDSPHSVSLEPGVAKLLIKYIEKVFEYRQEDHNT